VLEYAKLESRKHEVSSQISDIDSAEESKLPKAGFHTLFKNRQFMALWIAQVFSQFADRAVFVLFVAILTRTQANAAHPLTIGGAELTSWLYVAFTIPAILLSPIAGVYVDRWSHRSVMVLSNLVRAACVALIVLPAVSQSLKIDFALAFLISVGCQFFGPAETASIPRLVSKGELYAANSLFFTTMMIALGFGFAIGEPIISHIGMENAPWVVSGFFVIASCLLCTIGDNKQTVTEREPWWEELRFGLSYISSNALVFRAIMKITILFSTIITLNIIAVGLAQQVLHLQAFQFGYIVAAAGAGMGLGNFFVAHYGHRIQPNVLVYSGFTGLGFFLSAMGSLVFLGSWYGNAMSVPLTLALCVGISCACVAVPTQAALQAVVPEELRGKVFGAQNTAMSAASTIPVVLAGQLIDNLPGGVSTTLFLIGVPTALTGLYHLIRSLRSRGEDVALTQQ
jgi:MFS family permease